MDDADRAAPEIERYQAEALRRAARPLERGEAGVCDHCGEQSLRLVRGACARCRDKFKLG